MLRARPFRIAMFVLALILATVGFADSSLKLGAVFLGWDRVRSGALHDDAADLARDYARQIGHFCSTPEVFLRERTTSILSAEIFYENYLPFGARESMLLETASQRVALVTRRTSSTDVLSVMVALRSGVVLILC